MQKKVHTAFYNARCLYFFAACPRALATCRLGLRPARCRTRGRREPRQRRADAARRAQCSLPGREQHPADASERACCALPATKHGPAYAFEGASSRCAGESRGRPMLREGPVAWCLSQGSVGPTLPKGPAHAARAREAPGRGFSKRLLRASCDKAGASLCFRRGQLALRERKQGPADDSRRAQGLVLEPGQRRADAAEGPSARCSGERSARPRLLEAAVTRFLRQSRGQPMLSKGPARAARAKVGASRCFAKGAALGA